MCDNISWKDFPGGPVAKTSYYQCRCPGLIPGWGTKICKLYCKLSYKARKKRKKKKRIMKIKKK